jgi:hypothetical protein
MTRDRLEDEIDDRVAVIVTGNLSPRAAMASSGFASKQSSQIHPSFSLAPHAHNRVTRHRLPPL